MNIDYKELGKGIYNLLPDSDKGVVAFGMMPLYAMETATKAMKEKAGKIACDHYEIEQTPESISHFAKAVKKEFINEFELNLTLAILDAAKQADALLV